MRKNRFDSSEVSIRARWVLSQILWPFSFDIYKIDIFLIFFPSIVSRPTKCSLFYFVRLQIIDFLRRKFEMNLVRLEISSLLHRIESKRLSTETRSFHLVIKQRSLWNTRNVLDIFSLNGIFLEINFTMKNIEAETTWKTTAIPKKKERSQ